MALIQKLDAEALLTDECAVDDWQQVWSTKHIDWAVDGLGEQATVDVIPGIGPHRAEQLAAVGIQTVNDLLVVEPEVVADQTPFAESRVQRWTNLAAYYRGSAGTTVIDGIDQRAAEQLAEADIYTVEDLVAARPTDVAAKTTLAERTLKQWIGDAASRDITPVTELPKIGDERAEEFAKIGIFTVSDLADAEPADVATRTSLGELFVQDRIQKARNW